MVPISYSIHKRPVRVKVTSLMWACYAQASPPFLQHSISHQGIDGSWCSPTLVCVSCTLSSPIHAMFCTPAKSTASFHFTCGLKRALFSSVCKHCTVTSCKHCGGPTGSTGWGIPVIESESAYRFLPWVKISPFMGLWKSEKERG